jgi:hypothetical protein
MDFDRVLPFSNFALDFPLLSGARDKKNRWTLSASG